MMMVSAIQEADCDSTPVHLVLALTCAFYLNLDQRNKSLLMSAAKIENSWRLDYGEFYQCCNDIVEAFARAGYRVWKGDGVCVMKG